MEGQLAPGRRSPPGFLGKTSPGASGDSAVIHITLPSDHILVMRARQFSTLTLKTALCLRLSRAPRKPGSLFEIFSTPLALDRGAIERNGHRRAILPLAPRFLTLFRRAKSASNI
jgi:hypothetical protein